MTTALIQTDHDASPEDYVPQRVKEPDRRSALVKAREKFPGQKINACPFERDEKHLDKDGYCRHMIGFTRPEDGTDPQKPPEMYDPQKIRPGPNGQVKYDANGQAVGLVFTDGSDPQLLEPGDRLVLGTTSFRVYRNVDRTNALTR